MRQLIVTIIAKRDLAEIVEYVARSSGQTKVASRFGHDLLGYARRLADLPGSLGVQKPELGQDVRAAFHRGYVFIFRYEATGLRLLRVLEGHRNLVDQPTSGDT